MDDQPDDQRSPRPDVPRQSVSRSAPSRQLTLFIALFLVLLAGTAYAVYYWQHQKINSLNSKVTSLQAQLSKLQPAQTNSNYRGGPGGVKLTENIDMQIAQTLNELTLYKQQNGQYPVSATNIMLQNYWRYGYNGIAAGPNLKCPADNGYISYAGYTNPKTNKVDQFDLYYCVGNSVAHKTQADISTVTNQ